MPSTNVNIRMDIETKKEAEIDAAKNALSKLKIN